MMHTMETGGFMHIECFEWDFDKLVVSTCYLGMYLHGTWVKYYMLIKGLSVKNLKGTRAQTFGFENNYLKIKFIH